MDINDLPRQIEVTLIPEKPLVFSDRLVVFDKNWVVYSTERPLTKAEVEEVLSVGSLTLSDMKIGPSDPPIVNEIMAWDIAEFVSNQMRLFKIHALTNVQSWKIMPTTMQYSNEKEVRLSLVVIP